MKPANLAPGPRPSEMILRIPAIQADPVSYLMECARRYGDFVRFPIGNKPVFFVNHPEAIQKVLQTNNRNYTRSTVQYHSLARITGTGLLTSDGDAWLRQRRLIQPAFSRPNVQQMAEAMPPVILKTVEKLSQSTAPGNVVDVDEIMLHLALEIVGQSLFGADLSKTGSDLIHAVLTALDHIVARARTPVPIPSVLPTPGNLRFRKALDHLDDAAFSMIAGRRKSPLEQVDFLALLLATRDPDTGQPMDDRLIRDETVTLLIAGHETVASALTWTWYLLARNPSSRDRMHAEVDRLPSGKPVEVSDLPNLPYTRQVFDEGLRLYPPAWLITRQSKDPDELCGFSIPARSLVIISPYTIHRHPGFWETPETFDPSRFDPEPGTVELPKFAYIPFGGGPHLCIGNTFALIEAQLILANIAQRFQFDLIPGYETVPAVPLVTLRPLHGMKMRLASRERSA